LTRQTEKALQTHDIEVETRQPNGSTRTFRFLIVTASAMATTHTDQTTARLQRSSALTGTRDTALLYLLYSRSAPPPPLLPSPSGFTAASAVHAATQAHDASGVAGYVALQQRLLQQSEGAPLLPLLLVQSAAALPRTLDAYTAAAVAGSVMAPKAPTVLAVRDVLPWCSTGPAPLADVEVAVVSDLFASLRDLAGLEPYRDREWVAEVMARNGVDEGVVRSVLEFWDEEVIVDS